MSPTQRCLKHLRELGYTPAVVEKFNSFTKQRNDLYECIDILAVRPGMPVLGIQACAHSSMSARVKKCIENGQGWLATGHTQLQVWAFRKLKGHRKLQLDSRNIPLINQQFADAMNGMEVGGSHVQSHD